jgi:hypothetical protein
MRSVDKPRRPPHGLRRLDWLGMVVRTMAVGFVVGACESFGVRSGPPVQFVKQDGLVGRARWEGRLTRLGRWAGLDRVGAHFADGR